jgi:hypothetical protein
MIPFLDIIVHLTYFAGEKQLLAVLLNSACLAPGIPTFRIFQAGCFENEIPQIEWKS